MNPVRVALAVVGGAIFLGAVFGAIKLIQDYSGNSGLVPVGVIAGIGLGLLVASCTPQWRRPDD